MQVQCSQGEAERLQALQALGILDTQPEPHFDAVCRAARALFRAPIALVSLVAEDRIWFKAKCGIEADSVGREVGFCAHTILSDRVLVVSDTARDSRFQTNPLVAGEAGLRFYAGAPLILPSGARVGTLCVMDTRARRFTPEQATQLQELAKVVVAHLCLHEARAAVESEVQERRSREQALREQERLLSLAEQVAQVGHWRVTFPGCAFHWSDEVYRIHGRDPRGFSPDKEEAVAAYHPDDRDRVVAHFSQAAATGEGFTYQARLVRPDGEIRRVLTRAVCERDGQGGLAAIFGVLMDVTDLARAQTEVRENAARNRQILNAAHDAFVAINASGLITAWNTAAEATFGWSAEEAIGMPLTDTIIPMRARGHHQFGMDRALRTGRSSIMGQRLEVAAADRSGREFPIEITISKTEVDGVVAFNAFIRDITERKTLETALQDSEGRYRALIEASAAIVWRAAPNGSITDAQGWGEFSGQGSEDYKGEGWLNVIHPDDRERTVAIWLDCLRDRRLCQVEYRVRHVSGAYRWCSVKGVPLLNADGSIREWVGTLSDINERRWSELRLRGRAAGQRGAACRGARQRQRRLVGLECRDRRDMAVRPLANHAGLRARRA